MTKHIAALLILILSIVPTWAQKSFHRNLNLMGSGFQITVVVKDSTEADKAINLAINEITRIEKLISSWDPNSETSKINSNAGIRPVKVSRELYGLIDRAINISTLTDGAFDISYASMDKIWKFDGSMTKMPSNEEIKSSVSKVGFQDIILDVEITSVFLKEKGMKIGFGAIGKGYAADRAKALLQKNNIQAGIINASGDMNTWGRQPNGNEWTVAITNPLNKTKAAAILPITNGAVVTSGNYEKFVQFNGTRYAHIIDPRTGYPSTGILSVTVFAPKAELADALATSVFVMGIEIGLNRINQLPKIECIIIDEKGKVFTSDNIEIDRI
ncbi:MAG: FAD:protein FMN transferase [Eudoraea sp.]|nr:FAD:protein FMN transferase [Eudoraea sp.]